MKNLILWVFLIFTLTSCATKNQKEILKLQSTENIEDKDIQYKIGSLYFADSRYKEAFDWIIKAGNQGNSEAQKELCIQYRIGWFVKSDNQKAFEWCEKSANLGNSSGQFLLGTFYQRGNSAVKQDYKKAKEWFDKACDGGNQDGCDNYKILNQQGY
ncbi:tetratricopeptide repeat protein [Aliarcobacter butzleri]